MVGVTGKIVSYVALNKEDERLAARIARLEYLLVHGDPAHREGWARKLQLVKMHRSNVIHRLNTCVDGQPGAFIDNCRVPSRVRTKA
jgi:hypothetical protein